MEEFSVTASEVLCTVASLVLSGISYIIYRRSRADVEQLNKALHLPIDESLKDLIRVTPGESLQYAVIEGTVKSIGEPLRSQFYTNTLGVLQKFTLCDYWLQWNSTSRSWDKRDQVIHDKSSMVPFVLVGSDETTVRVQNPFHASGDYMETVYQKFHQNFSTFGETLGQYFSGVKPEGKLEIEKMLKVGTTLTGVGKLIMETDGTLSLRAPTNGAKYLLSFRDFSHVKEVALSSTFLWKFQFIICALLGVGWLSWIGFRYYRHLKALWRQEQEQRKFERLMAELLNTSELQDGQDNQPDNTCVICLNRSRNCALLDCGHVCCCYTCYQALPQPLCPICRQAIIRVLPLYHS
ncbi:mitochondrial ubiquitin ligase activator of nfkb 1-A-like [Gouania willdenowi]|uniref:RING-type E3 ubiquitin transferase n=1 Tax=Gouania willdenowi TaxID=441366 RepID=A0A8C5DYX6_GOUWI|nr:mitochondrial ubiquitin ligase activator of nfkb 1-A-like [Gouania willdenowi]